MSTTKLAHTPQTELTSDPNDLTFSQKNGVYLLAAAAEIDTLLYAGSSGRMEDRFYSHTVAIQGLMNRTAQTGQYFHRQCADASVMPQHMSMAKIKTGLHNGTKEIVESIVIMSMGLYQTSLYHHGRVQMQQLTATGLPNDV